VLFAEDLQVKVSDRLPLGKDPDEFVRERRGKAFQDVVAGAREFLDFLVEKTRAHWRQDSETEEKIQTASMLASVVARVPNPIRRDEYLRKVASKLDVSPKALLEASQKSAFLDKIEEEISRPERVRGADEEQCMWLVKRLIQRPEDVVKAREHFDVGMIQNRALRELFTTIFELEENNIDEQTFFDKVQNEEAQQILSHVMFEDAGPELLYPMEWWTIFIKSRQKEKEMASLSEKIAAAETAGNAELLRRLLGQKADIKRDLESIRKERMSISVETGAGSLSCGSKP